MTWAPPLQSDPFVGVDNPALPPSTGGVFNAFGWLRELVNTIIPQGIADMQSYQRHNP